MKPVSCPSSYFGHIEKQEMEMKWKLEMETGNRKLKTEIETIGCFASLASLPSLRLPPVLTWVVQVIVYVLSSILSLVFHT